MNPRKGFVIGKGIQCFEYSDAENCVLEKGSYWLPYGLNETSHRPY